MKQQGDNVQVDFFDNTGGVNTSDSPFRVLDSQSTGGRNFEYTLTGGFRKCKGATLINASPDTQLKSQGLGMHITYANVKNVMRVAGTKLQKFTISSGAFTNLTDDTSGASSALVSASTQPAVFSQFNSTVNNILWAAGGGLTIPYGLYDATANKVTKNGVSAPTGSITAMQATGTGTFPSTGKYFYGVAFRKASTQALSNIALDVSATITATTDQVTINVSGISNLDTTKYDKIYIYRSATNGVAAFTTGDLIAQINSTATTFVDTGLFIATAQNIARAGNTLLDNSELPANTYNVTTVWKRRLVVAAGSTLYCSDVNKPESWPLSEVMTIPSGGGITGLAIISFTSTTAQTIDEMLVVFKEREIWVVTGDDLLTGSLKFIDNIGCGNQLLIVNANGYIAWMEGRGVFLWDGSGKPIYASRPIEDKFQGSDSVVDRSKFNIAWGVYARERHEVVWVCSSQIDGENVYRIRMDLRLTLPSVQANLGGRVVDGVFIADVMARPYYSGLSCVPDSTELLLAGDASGNIYKLFDANDDAGVGVDFQYETKFHDFGTPGTTKRFLKVIAWCQASSDANIDLDYWTKYNSGSDDASTVRQQISQQVLDGLWDLGYWDATYWDQSFPGFNAVVFNLSSRLNNSNEGDCLKLRFKQSDANAPVTVAGYSVIFTESSMRK